MILKFKKQKEDENSFGYNLSPDYENVTKPRILTSMGEIKNIEMRPEVRGSGDPSDLPPYVIFKRGTPEAYARLSSHDEDTLYFVSEEGEDTGDLYLGDVLISSRVTIESELSPTSTNPVESRAIYQELAKKGSIFGDTTAGWNARQTMISQKDVLYVWTDYKKDENGNYISGFKFGDGVTRVLDLPFSDKLLYEHLDDMERHITQQEREFWNNKVRCYMSEVKDDNLIFTIN